MKKICTLLMAAFFATSVFAVPKPDVGGNHTKLKKAQTAACKLRGNVGCGGSGTLGWMELN